MLWLVGMMGSGKSTIGRRVASRVGADFVDTDELVAAVTDSSIAELWSEEGEEEFRRLESQMLASAASDDGVVVATGGGVVLDDDNIDLMRRSGRVVWLKAAPEVLAARLGRDSTRPLLAEAEDPVAVLRDLLAKREERYERLPTRSSTPEN
jgi:Shikimate kinase